MEAHRVVSILLESDVEDPAGFIKQHYEPVDKELQAGNINKTTLKYIGDYFWHRWLKDSKGRPLMVRRSGKTKTWKTRPNEFQIPVKYGLYKSFYITQNNANEWTIKPPDE